MNPDPSKHPSPSQLNDSVTHSGLAQPGSQGPLSPQIPVIGLSSWEGQGIIFLILPPATYCRMYILCEYSPEMGLSPSTQTPFMRRKFYLGCYSTENIFGPIRPCLGLSSGGSKLREANREAIRLLPSFHLQLSS